MSFLQKDAYSLAEVRLPAGNLQNFGIDVRGHDPPRRLGDVFGPVASAASDFKNVQCRKGLGETFRKTAQIRLTFGLQVYLLVLGGAPGVVIQQCLVILHCHLSCRTSNLTCRAGDEAIGRETLAAWDKELKELVREMPPFWSATTGRDRGPAVSSSFAAKPTTPIYARVAKSQVR